MDNIFSITTSETRGSTSAPSKVKKAAACFRLVVRQSIPPQVTFSLFARALSFRNISTQQNSNWQATPYALQSPCRLNSITQDSPFQIMACWRIGPDPLQRTANSHGS